MPDIRYVCLSDLHLGADNSVLTAIAPGSISTDTARPSALLARFAACLRDLIAGNSGADRPTLVLNGDALEMALSDVDEAAMAFQRFVELVFPADGEPLFQKNVIIIPGNHDHHIWESARETAYLRSIAELEPGDSIAAPTHATRMVKPELVPEPFVTSLLHVYPHLRDASVSVVYPSYAVLSQDGGRCVIFSHGQYVESIYSLMSTLNTMIFPDRTRPSMIGQVEAENFAWIDFLWGSLGRSGDVGQHIGLLYAKLQDHQQLSKLVANVVASWVERHNKLRPLEKPEEFGLNLFLKALIDKMHPLEKQRVDASLSADARHGLSWFMEDVLRNQIHSELGGAIPADIRFLFGHTHKPFEQVTTFAGYPAPVKVYNSGGWVVDTVNVSPLHGAAVLLVDEALDVVSVRMYDQATDPAAYAARVEEVTFPAEPRSELHRRIAALVSPDRDPWRSFSVEAARAVSSYEDLLRRKIEM
jgi:metallophosphoesterase superfamily enzyme